MKVTVVGAGRVGLATALVFDHIGHDVACIDKDENLIGLLHRRELPFCEPGLAPLLEKCNIQFASEMTEGYANADVVMVAVGTPPLPDGQADLAAVRAVAQATVSLLRPGSQVTLVIKSTVPPGITDNIQRLVEEQLGHHDCRVVVATNPEFLRGGAAIVDTLYPDRIVIGAHDEGAKQRLQELYRSIVNRAFLPVPDIRPANDRQSIPMVITTPVNAELVKYASNTFLVTRLSFVNELAGLAERVGGDIKEVVKGVGLDPRIGPHYMEAGIGWGGPCLGKDASALLRVGESHNYGMPMLRSAIEINRRQRRAVVEKLEQALGSLQDVTIGILGLAYKAGTDDITDSPGIEVASMLIAAGARVRGYDPRVAAKAARHNPSLRVCSTIEEVTEGCDALILISNAQQFQEMPVAELGRLMRRRVLVDAKNLLDQRSVEAAGFTYLGLGRSRRSTAYATRSELAARHPG